MPLRESLTQRQIFWFWLPLAAMWIMMAVEQPAIAAVTARLPEPEINLAAFGVTFALALLVEGPVIMLLTAGTALPRDRQSYRRLLHFTHLLAVGLTALHLLIGLTPLYRLIVGTLIGAPQEVIALSRQGFLILTPWSAAIAYRRLWQGVLIRFDRTRIVPVTIGARLTMTTLTLTLGLLLGTFQGIYVGTVGLSLGVTAAAIVSYAFARPTITTHLSRDAEDGSVLTWPDLLSFYMPLALTSLIVLANQPLFSTALSRAPQPLLSLAVWPVIMSLLFLGRSVALSFQEAVVALLANQATYVALRRFAWTITLLLATLFVLVAATPVARLWYAGIAGLGPNLVAFAMVPSALVSLVPAVSVLISWQRGILVHLKQTQHISHSVMLSAGVLIAILAGATLFLELPGATVAAMALTGSIMAEWIYLWWRSHVAAREAGLLPATMTPDQVRSTQ